MVYNEADQISSEHHLLEVKMAAGEKRPNPFGDEGSPDSKKVLADQIAAMKARLAAANKSKPLYGSGAQGHTETRARQPPPPPPSDSAAEAREKALAAARARIQANMLRVQGQEPPAVPLRAAPSSGAGLKMDVHPSLLSESQRIKRDAGTPQPAPYRPGSGFTQKQEASTKGKLSDAKKNPYYDEAAENSSSRIRAPRRLEFNEPGKYLEQAAASRKQAELDAIKARIAEQSRRAQLSEDRSEQAFLIPEPPAIEWWDAELVDGDEYPDFDYSEEVGLARLKLNDPTVINSLVQHPALIESPMDKLQHTEKPLFLTPQETKKKRRQERSEKIKEHQAKVRLGLEDPDPPKVKQKNLMRVLGDQAVQDPTAVEARVKNEVAERKEKHEETNEERKLTAEQRREKLAANQEKDAAKGIHCDVFRIDSLVFGKHRYKIDIFAKQHSLTGVTILNPKCCMVIVEGGEHSIHEYRKMVLQRTDWTENAPSTAKAEQKVKDPTASVAWLQPEDENGELRDLSRNKCVLMWEGLMRERQFGKWSVVIAELEGEVRNMLEKRGMEHMWQLAKHYEGAR